MILGALMVVEALGLVAIGWVHFDLRHADGPLQTFTFQALLFFALCSVVSIRERRHFWSSRPSAVLVWALLGDACVGIAIGTYGLGELRPLPVNQTACVVGCAVVFSLIVNDFIKAALIKRADGTPRPLRP